MPCRHVPATRLAGLWEHGVLTGPDVCGAGRVLFSGSNGLQRAVLQRPVFERSMLSARQHHLRRRPCLVSLHVRRRFQWNYQHACCQRHAQDCELMPPLPLPPPPHCCTQRARHILCGGSHLLPGRCRDVFWSMLRRRECLSARALCPCGQQRVRRPSVQPRPVVSRRHLLRRWAQRLWRWLLPHSRRYAVHQQPVPASGHAALRHHVLPAWLALRRARARPVLRSKSGVQLVNAILRAARLRGSVIILQWRPARRLRKVALLWRRRRLQLRAAALLMAANNASVRKPCFDGAAIGGANNCKHPCGHMHGPLL